MPGAGPEGFILPSAGTRSTSRTLSGSRQWSLTPPHRTAWVWALSLLLAAALLASAGVVMISSSLEAAASTRVLDTRHHVAGPLPPGPLLRTGRDHLLLYAFSNSDAEALANLQYFVQEAVLNDTLADFIVIVQQGPTLQTAALPALPRHAAYVRHQNVCYDWGSYGWLLLQTALVNIGQYRYFFFVNSSVRGPFLPAYARGTFNWMSAFTSRLNDDVKLVGSTISCEGSPLHGKRQGRWRQNPHVQSYALATDAVGLGILQSARTVFACQRDRWGTIYYAELGASAAVLAAGYNLDCLLLRYQGVDWRDARNWGCNARLTPTFEFSNDGSSVDPLEVMFVKVKRAMLANEITYSKKAAKYAAWQAQARSWAGDFASLAANDYVDAPGKHRAPAVLTARARGAQCFDFNYYMKANGDVRAMWDDVRAMWRHWVYYGQFEYRPHKWTCDVDYRNISSWPN